jgi:hypothetical protein
MAERDRLTPMDTVEWNKNSVATEVDREVVLMSLERGRCYGLGETGSAIWKRLERPVRIADLCAGLQAEYSGDPEVIAADVLRLLEQLLQEGLIEVRR